MNMETKVEGLEGEVSFKHQEILELIQNVGDKAGLTGMGDVHGFADLTGMDYGKGIRSGGNTMASTANRDSALGMYSPPQNIGTAMSQMGIAGGLTSSKHAGGLTLNHSQENLHGGMYENMMHGLVGSPRNTVHGHYP